MAYVMGTSRPWDVRHTAPEPLTRRLAASRRLRLARQSLLQGLCTVPPLGPSTWLLAAATVGIVATLVILRLHYAGTPAGR